MKATRGDFGFTLIELMVALALGSVAMLGATRLYIHAAAQFRTAQAELLLEQSAQLAISALRTDIEQAGFFGLLSSDDPLALGLEQPGIAVRGDCGEDWSTRIQDPIAAEENVSAWTCGAYADSVAPGSDSLVLRYADPITSDSLEAGRIYMRTSAVESARLFVAQQGPPLSDHPLEVTHLLRARGYYVSMSSAADTPDTEVPSLRVKRLTRRGRRPAIIDEEIQSGVEDLQVEFITDSGLQASSAPRDTHGIRAVRVWLLVRSRLRESNTVSSIPAYADRSSTVFSDGYRRRLFQYTIALRYGPLR